MMTFTPPTVARVPSVLLETRGAAMALFRHYPPMLAGQNVWRMPDGTYLLDQQPIQLSNPDPVNHDNDAVTAVATYYGGHTYQVTDAVAAELTAAGFGANLSPALPPVNPGNPTFGTTPPYYDGQSPPNTVSSVYLNVYTRDYT